MPLPAIFGQAVSEQVRTVHRLGIRLIDIAGLVETPPAPVAIEHAIGLVLPQHEIPPAIVGRPKGGVRQVGVIHAAGRCNGDVNRE